MSRKIAPNSLDFCADQSVTVPIDGWGAVINEAIKACLSEIHSRLNEATCIAKAAEACASQGASPKA
jgi:hypothetical protein